MRINRKHRPLRCVALLLLPLVAAAGCGKKPDAAPTRQITTKTGVEMVLVPAGEFLMGDDGGYADQKPAHKVRVDAFWMDKYEVTRASYRKIMGTLPPLPQSVRQARKARNIPDDPLRPVEAVSWFDAIKYCNMRSIREGLKPCYNLETQECDFTANGYRLPTEAEWEYACRAGTTTKFSCGNRVARLKQYAWFKASGVTMPQRCGTRKPNAFGLYDLHGNVLEWCHDVYAKDYYRRSPAENPRGPEKGDERVVRGGCWRSPAENCASAYRDKQAPGFADACFDRDLFGFRCVRKAD